VKKEKGDGWTSEEWEERNMRSGKNAIIRAVRREERRRQLQAPNRDRGRRKGKTRERRSLKNAIAIDCWQAHVLCPSINASSRLLSIGTCSWLVDCTTCV